MFSKILHLKEKTNHLEILKYKKNLPLFYYRYRVTKIIVRLTGIANQVNFHRPLMKNSLKLKIQLILTLTIRVYRTPSPLPHRFRH